MSKRASRRFFRRDPVTLAHALLGQRLVRRLEDGTELVGRIVEVEAYLGIPDRAAHTFGGRRTERNASMWGEAGLLYVYFTYGMHHCANIVAEREGVPTACLLRALEPVEGIEIMKGNRAGKISRERLRETDLCSGPAKLTQALGIDRRHDGVDLATSEELFVSRGRPVPQQRIVRARRVGVGYAREWASKRLRFYLRDSRHVSVR